MITRTARICIKLKLTIQISKLISQIFALNSKIIFEVIWNKFVGEKRIQCSFVAFIAGEQPSSE